MSDDAAAPAAPPPAQEEPAPTNDAAPAAAAPAEETKPATEQEPAAATQDDEQAAAAPPPASEEQPAAAAAEPAKTEDAKAAAPAPVEQEKAKPSSEEQPAKTAEEEPAAAAAAEEDPEPAAKKAAAPKKKAAAPSERSASEQPQPTTARRQSAVPTDPFVGLTAIERVRLGYKLAHTRFSQRRPSAAMLSTTARDPYSSTARVPLTKSPQLLKREELDEARRAHFASKTGYNPATILPPSEFDASKPNKDMKRSSSWTRDRTTRRPFASSYDHIPSSRTTPTPGPGSYTDPMRNYAGWS